MINVKEEVGALRRFGLEEHPFFYLVCNIVLLMEQSAAAYFSENQND